MVEQDNRRGRTAIVAGDEGAPRSVLLFHGYTGSPGEFGDLPEMLARELHARVHVPLLPGHGTSVADLQPFDFADFTRAAERAFDAIDRSRPYAIIGHSFGSYLAAHVASGASPVGLVLAATPYLLRFSLSFPGARYVSSVRPYWGKKIDDAERAARKDQFYYESMPGKGLGLAMDGNTTMADLLSNITCPLLTLQSRNDPLALVNSGEELSALSRSAVQENRLFNEGWHGLFYGDVQRDSKAAIIDFLRRAFEKKS